MPITDTERDRRPLKLFDDENRAKVRRPIGAIDHDGWGYITYGPHYDMMQALNLSLFNFAAATNNFFANTVNARSLRGRQGGGRRQPPR